MPLLYDFMLPSWMTAAFDADITMMAHLHEGCNKGFEKKMTAEITHVLCPCLSSSYRKILHNVLLIEKSILSGIAAVLSECLVDI